MGMTNEEIQKFLSEHPAVAIVEAPKIAENENLAVLDTVDASRAIDSDIEIPAPAGLEFYPFQKAGIEYASKRAMTLIGDEPGLGKTLQAVGLSNLLPEIRKVLIVCPASLKINWKREWEKWDVKDLYVEIVKKQFSFADVCVLNYDILKKWRKEIREIEWDLLVIDESHFLKSAKAQRTREVLGGIKRNADREIVERVSAIPAARRLFLTGTPIVNKPKELWPMIQVLDPTGLGANWYDYAKRYCQLWEIKNREGKRIGWKWDGASNLSELQNRLRSSFMVRRLKQDVLMSLPAKIRQVVSVEPSSSIQKLIKSELTGYEDFAKRLKKTDGENLASFQTGSTVRKQLGLAKVKFAVEHLKELLNEREKIVAFAHHLEVLDRLAGEFPGECVQLDGRTSMDARDQAVRAFQSDPKIKIFFGGLQAAGVGLTLTAASTVLFVEFDWVPGNNFQAEDRCHRIGQKDCVNVQYIVFAGSLDERIASTDICKQEVINAALDL